MHIGYKAGRSVYISANRNSNSCALRNTV